MMQTRRSRIQSHKPKIYDGDTPHDYDIDEKLDADKLKRSQTALMMPKEEQLNDVKAALE
jgi:hypothetical protein